MGGRLESLSRLWPYPPGGQGLNLTEGNSKQNSKMSNGVEEERGEGGEGRECI